MKTIAHALLIASMALLLGAAPAQPKPPAPPATAPVDGARNAEGLSAHIVATKDTYTLDPAQSGKEFRDTLEALKNPGRGPMGGAKPPTPPAVDVIMRITNTSDKNVTINIGGDDSQVQLKLTGPGAVILENNVAMTMEFRIGKPVVIEAGKSYDLKISSLGFGLRGITHSAFWTEPGEYTLAAVLVYTTGEKQSRVESSPAKLKVEAAKKP